jgi:hypothetical protein
MYDVRYLLKGKVHRQNGQLRVNVQLIDSDNGHTVFSTINEGESTAHFSIQTEVVLEVAAALRLVFNHRKNDGTFAYASALSRLGHINVEKLVLARKQLLRYSEGPVERAIKSLNELNQNYPDTPQVLGLLSFAHTIFVSVSSFKTDYSTTVVRDLALRAITLDKTNLDALITLYYDYRTFAEFQGHATQTALAISKFHPGLNFEQRISLDQHVQNLGSCQQLQPIVDAPLLGSNVAKRLALKQMIDHCANLTVLTSADDKIQVGLYQYAYLFRLKQDAYYQALQNFSQRNANQRFLSQIYCHQLIMGAEKMATATFKRLGELSEGVWLFEVAQCSYAANQATAFLSSRLPSHLPSQFIDFVQQEFNSNSRLSFVASLVQQVRQGEADNRLLSDFLDQVPPFNINPANSKKALGLVMLQYHAGHKKQSLATARQLLFSLNQYQQNSPDAYKFWSLAYVHFATALYANDSDKAAQLLESGFSPQEAYWLHNKSLMLQVLSPWHDLPLVTSYLQRIDADAQRARLKFGLY